MQSLIFQVMGTTILKNLKCRKNKFEYSKWLRQENPKMGKFNEWFVVNHQLKNFTIQNESFTIQKYRLNPSIAIYNRNLLM